VKKMHFPLSWGPGDQIGKREKEKGGTASILWWRRRKRGVRGEISYSRKKGHKRERRRKDLFAPRRTFGTEKGEVRRTHYNY